MIHSTEATVDEGGHIYSTDGRWIRIFSRILILVFSMALSWILSPARAEPVSQEATSPSSPLAEIHAQLKPHQETILSSELAARVEHIAVREGERFAEKTLLVRLDCALERARLTKMKAILTSARKVARIQKRLLELHSTGTLEEALARIDVRKARADIKIQSITLSKCTISAPFSGRVVTVMAKEHQFVRSGEPLLEILDDSSLDIDFIAPSHWLSWLKVGQQFSIVINETKRSYPGEIVRLGAKVDPVSQLVKVMGKISDKFPDLMPGMSGRVLIAPPQPSPQVSSQ
uniref:RND family efflux transporter, MFP subunit n=1 Tax=Candidatus Kentrum sp. MB TaxID=2138164 RepID=A0A451BDD9_9GAMM|nr:MAG: RND family efflux transporter, MFP subunit [Candidatus Kentron sp. MB]VFK33679.1 MAG: RND family efflux transporter, MFP subunit [Candidatus Kentron sp. MB]VFK76297.1 MAG: RND family efflux transporter, MFP subunit [Candidatus Kentron sp. MB]